MSTLPDSEFDLEKLFLPAWAQEEPSSNKYAKYEGLESRSDSPGDRRGPRVRRDRPPGARRDEKRGFGDRRRPGPDDRSGPRKPRGDRPGHDREDRRGPGRGAPHDRRPPPAPLVEVNVSLVPEDKGVESLARQIKMTGRAFPLFDIAQMILQKPERYNVTFSVKKNAEGKPIQPLFVCALDDTLWLSEDEAIAHVLQKHFATFYQAERTPTEPPKGKYTFVAQCGMSGVILGPPNYHDYQNQLRKLHGERFSRMPFEVYKSRVKIVRDEAVVKKWVEDQSWKTDYLCLNMPEALKLASMEAVEQHFREQHKANIIKPVEAHTLSGTAARNLRSPELNRLQRSVWEDQRRFPLQIATVLSQQFASHGLQFFKVNKTITHVSVARPHYLDLALTPVSDGVKKIVDYINANPRCTRRKLVETLAPTPPAPAAPAPAAEAPAPAGESTAPTPVQSGPTPEQNAVIGDLHWLIHQGHVIEFANGTLETAKKPIPRPPKPTKKDEKTTEKPPEGVVVEGEQPGTAEAPAQDQSAETPGETAPKPEEAAVPEHAPESATAASAPETEQVEQLDKQENPPAEPAPPSNAVTAGAETPAAPVESPS